VTVFFRFSKSTGKTQILLAQYLKVDFLSGGLLREPNFGAFSFCVGGRLHRTLSHHQTSHANQWIFHDESLSHTYKASVGYTRKSQRKRHPLSREEIRMGCKKKIVSGVRKAKRRCVCVCVCDRERERKRERERQRQRYQWRQRNLILLNMKS